MKTVGLTGCGKWGKNILRDLLSLGCRVHVADADPDMRDRALAGGAASACGSWKELPECDGHVVAVPIPDLAPVSLGLLRHRKPIFVEKTLCLSTESAKRLAEAGGDEHLFVMHKWHYHPGIEALRQIAVSGQIGSLREILSIRHGWNDGFHAGDIYSGNAVHDITIFEHILGALPSVVQWAHQIKDASGTPVSVAAAIGKGPVAVLSANGRHAKRKREVSITGTKGSAVLTSPYEDHVDILTEDGPSTLPIDTTFPLLLELKEFIAHLEGGKRPRCGLKNAEEVWRLLLTIREHAEGEGQEKTQP